MKRSFFAAAAVLLAASCGGAEDGVLQGYAEADYVYLSPQDGGVVADLLVREGAEVAEGAILFRLAADRYATSAASAAAEAQSAVAAGGASLQAVAEAEAQAELARRTYARSEELFARGFVARAKLDTDRAALDAAIARVRQARAARAAAQTSASAAQAQSGLAAQRVSDLAVAAPAAGRIERVYRRPGEVVAAGQPVLALLPPENMKVRFFAPEPMLARLQLGDQVAISCDNCPEGLTAQISFIDSEPQFTPPIIYSVEERDTLVFLIEARPDRPEAIRPGLPIDVRVRGS